ncbi:hypothetical protein [Bacillus alkalicola]|uniref:Uncharacterized protein n=1 Tax=Evansella alkalicola TaxID=745819 RepID=A0ABS6JZX7_9BACI|nr:hypothetical protein [Bacillus alkalicola]MBU9724144.1 hypothetical protein [Bacillus alkalicola]
MRDYRIEQKDSFTSHFKEEINQIKNSQFVNQQSINDQLHIVKGLIRDIEDMRVSLSLDGYGLVSAYISAHGINKHDLLQVINVNKDKFTTDAINEAPEVLTYEDFTSLIFVHRIEKDDDCYLFEFMFTEFFDAMDKSPKLKQSMSKLTDDLFPGLQKYNATYDEFGDITSMEQIYEKPRLV